MNEKDHELLDKAYEMLHDVDRLEVLAIAEKYIYADEIRTFDIYDIKALAAYILINNL